MKTANFPAKRLLRQFNAMNLQEYGHLMSLTEDQRKQLEAARAVRTKKPRAGRRI